jgi:hypothetical protein
VKKTIALLVFIFAVIDAGVLWIYMNARQDEAGEKAEAAEAGPKVSRDSDGNIVLKLSDEEQTNLDLEITNAAKFRLSPEVKGYGRVLDPSPLVSMINDLAVAQSAAIASSKELERLKVLEPQGNTSLRAVQSAEAAAQRDQLAVQAAKDRLNVSWGRALAGQKDLPALVQALSSLESVLVRVDIPAGEKLASPKAASLLPISGGECQAEFLSLATSVEPQLQGRGFLFLVRLNALKLAPGEAVTGYLTTSDKPTQGVLVPGQAVVRNEGAGWVYTVKEDKDGKMFIRKEIALDRNVEGGWFVRAGLKPEESIVVRGAQQLLSIEQHGGGAPD